MKIIVYPVLLFFCMINSSFGQNSNNLYTNEELTSKVQNYITLIRTTFDNNLIQELPKNLEFDDISDLLPYFPPDFDLSILTQAGVELFTYIRMYDSVNPEETFEDISSIGGTGLPCFNEFKSDVHNIMIAGLACCASGVSCLGCAGIAAYAIHCEVEQFKTCLRTTYGG